MRIVKPEELLDAEVNYQKLALNGKIVEAFFVHNEHEIKASFEVSPLSIALETANRVERLFKNAGYQVCHAISLDTFEERITKIEIEYTISWDK